MIVRSGIFIMALLMLAACGGDRTSRERQEALDGWEHRVRWSVYDSLVDFIHPEWLEENPISELDLERLHQFRITEYRVRAVLAHPDGEGLDRRTRIRMVNIHTQRERVIDHTEVWRYDEDLKRWLLHSGLPDPRRY